MDKWGTMAMSSDVVVAGGIGNIVLVRVIATSGKVIGSLLEDSRIIVGDPVMKMIGFV
jgi:hypothetical protein